MRYFKLNKLVRDGVFDSMLELGQKPEYKKLSMTEFIGELKKKIIEEGQEFDAKNPKALEELADLAEIIEQLALGIGADHKRLRAAQLSKRKKAGSFKRRVFIGKLGLNDDDPWAEYYAKDPARFPEKRKLG